MNVSLEVHTQGIWDETTKGDKLSATMKELLEAGVHFGHQTERWNPKMDKYIYNDKSGIHILDLRITYSALEEAQEFVQKLVANSGKVLFVGTKPQAQKVVEEQATRAQMPYVNQRWLGGMLTNFKTIIKRVVYLKELNSLETSGEINSYPKPERLRIKREIAKRGIHKKIFLRCFDEISKDKILNNFFCFFLFDRVLKFKYGKRCLRGYIL